MTRPPGFWAWDSRAGPEIQRVSQGSTGEVNLPRAWMRGSRDFSFSGLKTALLHQAQAQGIYPEPPAEMDEVQLGELVRELAAGFQESVVDVVSAKLVDMARDYRVKGLVLGGGVTANARLREEITKRSPFPVIIPPPCPVHRQRSDDRRLRLLPVPARRRMADGIGH